MAQATRCVKLTLPAPWALRCLLRMVRFSSSVRTGTVRTDVAVGMVRLASMFSTMRTAPPRIGCAMSPGRMAGTTSAFERDAPGAPDSARTSCTGRATTSAAAGLAAAGLAAAPDPSPATGAGEGAALAAAGAAAGAGCVVTAAGAACVVPAAGAAPRAPVMRSKYSRQLSSTACRSFRYSSSRSSANT